MRLYVQSLAEKEAKLRHDASESSEIERRLEESIRRTQ